MMREEEWIEAARQGDQDAFAELVRLYEKRVFALTTRMCRNPEDAAEAAQEAFLSAWQGLRFFRGEASFSTWLYRLASNACVDLLRREGRHRAAAGASLDDEEIKIDAVDPGAVSAGCGGAPGAAGTGGSGAGGLVSGAPAGSGAAGVHQLSYDEISQVLSLDVGTVKSRISRGRRQLRKFLLESGNFSGAAASKETEKEGCK